MLEKIEIAQKKEFSRSNLILPKIDSNISKSSLIIKKIAKNIQKYKNLYLYENSIWNG